MKKKVLIGIILLIIFIFSLFHFIIPSCYRYYYSKNYRGLYEKVNRYQNQLPQQGIGIICLKDETGELCTNKTTFKCGEKIMLIVKVSSNGTFYTCMNMSYFNLPWVCGNRSVSSFLFVEPEIVIPSITGRIPFVEVYLFPDKNYTSLGDLLADISSSQKIMSLERYVIC
jgi:hypothetical protein